MKKTFLLKSTSLLVVLFAAVTLFFTSANTKEEVNNQAIAELSEKVTQLNEELAALKTKEIMEGPTDAAHLGEIAMFAGNFPPRGWAFCNGQLLPISQNSALFSLVGTFYGGDGRSTFALPDLRGRVPLHVGGRNETGPGLSNYALGQKGGSESITTDMVKVTNATSGGTDVVRKVSSGTMQPYLGINYIIALEGRFPPRS